MAPQPFTIECVVLGRNDDYEVNWADKLEGAIRYNRSHFSGTRVQFNVAFVEWNPPPDKPLLGPSLVEKYSFLRAIVVDARVHDQLCEAKDLHIMLNFACNAALRTTLADYVLITGGDDFLGLSVARRIINDGLKPGCLYRAERVNVRADLNFVEPSAAELELPENVVAIDTCSDPPYDVPPYTNASGDFLMLDTGTMNGIRGLDEGITFARLHLDSRFCANAMQVVDDCRLLGRIFHINHGASYNNRPNVAGRAYNADWDLPYVNSPDWGLACYQWSSNTDRLHFVTPPVRNARERTIPDNPSVAVRTRAKAVVDRLAHIRTITQRETPAGVPQSIHALDLSTVRGQEDWASTISNSRDGIRLQTSAVQWGYAAMIPLEVFGPLRSDLWHWLVIRATMHRGALGAGCYNDGDFNGERYIVGPGAIEIAVPLRSDARAVMLRNVAGPEVTSDATLHSASIVSCRKAETNHPMAPG